MANKSAVRNLPVENMYFLSRLRLDFEKRRDSMFERDSNRIVARLKNKFRVK